MRKILICTRKNKEQPEVDLEEASAAIYKAAAEKRGIQIVIVRDEQLPWRDLKAIHGSFNGAADAAGRRYDTVVLVEVDTCGERTIGKGQYRIAQAALESGNSVVVARPSSTTGSTADLHAVKGLEVYDADDWQTSYGRVEI